MSFFVVDVESDGPIPYKNSMICFGAVRVDEKLNTTFYSKVKPIFDTATYEPNVLAISGFSREQHLAFDDARSEMIRFKEWIMDYNISKRPVFISDNPAYDWQWINFYFHYYDIENPFGYSARRIGDIYCGYKKDLYAQWKNLRDTKHTHNPVDDAKGNAEAFIKIQNMLKG